MLKHKIPRKNFNILNQLKGINKILAFLQLIQRLNNLKVSIIVANSILDH